MEHTDYSAINKKSWNDVVDIHMQSEFYDVAGLLAGNSSLNEIELALLGDIRGKSVLHLQCHFGQDTISLSRLGASVTGVDFSKTAIAAAKQLALRAGTDTAFLCCDINTLPQILEQKYDLVFTSYGTICWHPELGSWAKTVAHFLKPGGRFIFVEFHPIVWAFDNELARITYSYFNEGAIREITNGTYADKDADIARESITWNHSIADVLNSLIGAGLTIAAFHEYDYSPYDCWSNVNEIAPKRFQPKFEGKIPMVFALAATKQ